MSKIFISHSSIDKVLVDYFIEFLNLAFDIPRKDIYSTSERNQIVSGQEFVNDIKKNLINSDLIIMMISKNFLKSKFCLNEMGAIWITDSNVIPILIEDVSFDVLNDSVFIGKQVKKISNQEDMETIIDELRHFNIIDDNVKLSNYSKRLRDLSTKLKSYSEEFYIKYAERIKKQNILNEKEIEESYRKIAYNKYLKIISDLNEDNINHIKAWKELERLKDEYNYYEDEMRIMDLCHPECDKLRKLAMKVRSNSELPFKNSISDYLKELTKSSTTPFEREKIGLYLAKNGDPRKGIGNNEGIPDIEWVEIPAGNFLYEYDNRKVYLDTFYISKYPITQIQYEAFINSKYIDSDNNEQWEYNRKMYWYYNFDEVSVRERDEYNFITPYSNAPMVDITWNEANAFCKWLESKIDIPVRLPATQEWEKAARGIKGRIFPYGNKFDKFKGNTKETEITELIAVGMFPLGSSIYGVHDMAGNVWQWTNTEYSRKEGYVNRGGSYGYSEKYARCFSSGKKEISYRSKRGGFRIVTTMKP